MSPPRKRADILLVERGLFESRARARAAIEAGLVIANDKPVVKPSETIAADATLQAQPAHPFVSRGGVKLAGALETYPIEIEDHVCLDVGASTGGFSDCMLQHGAARVIAVDTGYGQIDFKLRNHLRTKLRGAGVSRVVIERPAKKARVVLSFLKEVGFAAEAPGARFAPLATEPPSIDDLARAGKLPVAQLRCL